MYVCVCVCVCVYVCVCVWPSGEQECSQLAVTSDADYKHTRKHIHFSGALLTVQPPYELAPPAINLEWDE